MGKQVRQYNHILKYTLSVLGIVIVVIFSYYGFFPFNLRETEYIHIKVYDSIHLAFNIPNIQTSEANYYCSLRLKEIQRSYLKNINTLEQAQDKVNQNINEIDGQITQSPAYLAVNHLSYRYGLTSYDINRLKQLYKAKNTLEKQRNIIDDDITQIKQKMFRECKKF